MQSISPVFTENEVELERVIALDQPEYLPIIILPIQYSDGNIGAAVRFKLSDEERRAITEGADLVVTELTFGRAFTPINIAFCKKDEIQ